MQVTCVPDALAEKSISPRGSRVILSGVLACAMSLAITLHASLLLTHKARAQGVGAATTRQFNIPAQPLTKALAQFGRQSGLQVASPAETSQGVRSNAVIGILTPHQALSRLLQGTGISYRITQQGTAVIGGQQSTGTSDVPPPADGSLVLDTIDVTGGGGSISNSDTPFETPGSVSHVSREQLDRVPPTSAGDVFVSTPGVISAGNRVGTSINPNIRGLQGMGRVVTTVDGAQQTTSSYRGYTGNRDETYIDPDMIGGIDITKGPSSGAGSGLGGTVAFRTLLPEDIVKDGQGWGVRLRGSVGSNTAAPPEVGTAIGAKRPSFLEGDTWSGSAAVATVQDNFEAVAAFSKRKLGNYFTGTRVPDGIVFSGQSGANPNTVILPGAEAVNTSEDTTSALLKGKAKWGDGQSLEFGYLLYDSQHGEIDELFFSPFRAQAQRPLTTTRVDTYTAKYRWNPAANDLFNLRANLWYSDVDVDRGSNGLDSRDHQMGTTGGDVGNTARFDSSIGAFTLDTGLAFVREHATAIQTWNDRNGRWESFGPSGIRTMINGYSSLKLDFTDWLSINGGGRYDRYESEGDGYLADYPVRSGSRFSPNYGITLTPVPGIQLFGQYKEGYRAPSLRESHWNYESLLINNPNLEAETSESYEVGLNLLRSDVFATGDRLRFKAAYFDNRYNNYIIRAPINGTSSPYHFTNIDHANYEGFELSGSYDAGIWFGEAAITKYRNVEYCQANGICVVPAMGGFTASTDPLRNDYATNYIPPEYAGSITLGARLFEQRLTLGGRVHFSSVRFGSSWSDASEVIGQVGMQFTWPTFAVYDIFGSYKISEDAILNFSVENITDEYYFGALSSAGIASPGRTARMSLTYNF